VTALIVALALVLLFAVATRGPNATPRDIVLPPGGGVAKIADALARAKVIRWRGGFVAWAEATGAAKRLKAGEYVFPAHVSLGRAVDMIARGQVVRRAVTIPEGLTSKAAAAIIDAKPSLVGNAPVAPEGALLPDTYDVKPGETRAAVVSRMRAARDALLAKLWATRAPGLPYANPGQAVVLASIVEKETAKPSERPRIAAIFVHRLQKGMRLESDPTIIYGLTGGVPLGHGLRVSELASDTPYNTYKVGGLPPTPIGNPGRASLEAAMHPAPGDDLYFVADGTGGHVFSDNYADHLRNVAKWRAIETAKAGAR
jgi:UPF0755 protein